jgi:hypothetical protein
MKTNLIKITYLTFPSTGNEETFFFSLAVQLLEPWPLLSVS